MDQPPGREEPVRSPVTGVRPYVLTGGRVRPVHPAPLNIAAQIRSTPHGMVATERLTYEHRDIVELCDRWISVAEVAAHLRLHLGVVRVLVADLAALGLLDVHEGNLAGSRQVAILERVIRGLTAIR
ncbi:DUF742 domain-containing protein [Streptosporangium sp. NBC_01755]|uniref:DUF742 domain-containing protein n=1 Tax=Streptosporangium sp. NBC_01755 TaxID=2975949 RepID=UPI002DD98D8A|nr:DUF742 domain-containing protein [Streptosporangium sp. NBC_01755]WSC97180.1 DUF742 domain-containing protein [Streptosporangium sp. NBC_01755]